MKEPWTLKTDDTRHANALATFIIFCEDGEVEPEYFRTFATHKVKISPTPNCGKQHKQVDYATDHCRENALLEVDITGKEKLKLDEGAQVWCVFDRDKETNDGKDSTFNNSIAVANEIGMKTAWSNDDFELWILLHFEDVPSNEDLYKHRSKYYERLTAYLKAEAKTEEEKRIIDHASFDYYSAMKSKKRFLGITYQHMRGKTEIAIGRAENLHASYQEKVTPNEQCPCTLVYLLVRELVRLG